ncbi:MAG: tetratricopeptide repeat protein [Abitibacteriaceae bacterium]|nr:tetratricopeptide repeat protein [Abditibacteriaceae bacterium]
MNVSRESRQLKQLREEDILKYQRALQLDANNASFHALLADKYLEAGRRDEAIQEFRTAIGLSPEGPQTQQWKLKLRHAIDAPARQENFNFTVCSNCQADQPAGTKVCSRCGATMHMSFGEWLMRPENFKPVVRQTIVAGSIALLLLTIFSSLSIEWKACVACGTVIVGGFSFLRYLGQ